MIHPRSTVVTICAMSPAVTERECPNARTYRARPGNGAHAARAGRAARAERACPSVRLPPSSAPLVILSVLLAARLRPRAAKPQSGRRAGEAGLDLVQKLLTRPGSTLVSCVR